MPKPVTKHIQNTHPTGDVWNPLVGYVDAGAVIEVDAAVADELSQQIGNWLIVDAPSED